MPDPVIVCPACRGTLTNKITGTHCHFCEGKRTMSAEKARSYATVLERLAMDGLVSGLMSQSEIEEMRREAAELRDSVATL